MGAVIMAKAFIVGATGEVGKQVLAHLAKSSHFSNIVVLSRKPIGYEGEGKDKIVTEIVPDFDNLDAHKLSLSDCTYGFCTLGTTKTRAGSAAAFEKIDYGYTLTVAKIAKESGCKWFGIVTSVGANANSSFLYPRVKGLIEKDLIALQFQCLEIFRPGMLLCNRQESRPLEAIGMAICKAINWIAPNRLAISTDTVAKAMVYQAEKYDESTVPGPCVSVYENYEISKLA